MDGQQKGPAGSAHHNFTFVFGDTHRADGGGQLYNKNIADGDVRAMYGNIEPPIESLTHDQRSRTSEDTARVGPPGLGVFHPMPSTGTHASSAGSFVDTGVSEHRAYLHTPLGAKRDIRDRSRSTTSFGPDHSRDETQITLDPIPLSEFERRLTGRWYGFGKVFEISDQHEDRTIASRCMVVVGRASGLVCLPLCRYRHVTSRDTDFIRHRLRLQCKGAQPSGQQSYPTHMVEIEISGRREIHDDIYINCERPYTVHYAHTEVAYVGDLTPEGADKMAKSYIDAQQSMMKPSETKPTLRALWDTICHPFGFVTGRRHGRSDQLPL